MGTQDENRQSAAIATPNTYSQEITTSNTSDKPYSFFSAAVARALPRTQSSSFSSGYGSDFNPYELNPVPSSLSLNDFIPVSTKSSKKKSKKESHYSATVAPPSKEKCKYEAFSDSQQAAKEVKKRLEAQELARFAGSKKTVAKECKEAINV